jgi:hypothetical protein
MTAAVTLRGCVWRSRAADVVAATSTRERGVEFFKMAVERIRSLQAAPAAWADA